MEHILGSKNSLANTTSTIVIFTGPGGSIRIYPGISGSNGAETTGLQQHFGANSSVLYSKLRGVYNHFCNIFHLTPYPITEFKLYFVAYLFKEGLSTETVKSCS